MITSQHVTNNDGEKPSTTSQEKTADLQLVIGSISLKSVSHIFIDDLQLYAF